VFLAKNIQKVLTNFCHTIPIIFTHFSQYQQEKKQARFWTPCLLFLFCLFLVWQAGFGHHNQLAFKILNKGY